MVESTDYSYLCRLYRLDADESGAIELNLPGSIQLQDFIDSIKHQDLSNIGRIKITQCTTNVKNPNFINLYVDDRVQTSADIQSLLKRNYGSVCGFYPAYADAPAVITGHKTLHKSGVVPAHNIYSKSGGRFYKDPQEYTWEEPYALVRSLTPNDIMVQRRNLCQIWPTVTQQPPVALMKFFENKR